MNQFIALHDADAEHMRKKTFPNYALMKLSAYHKTCGDSVVWFDPMLASTYDKVYSSKVFDFTPVNPYLPPNTIKGGTGYGIYEDLPLEIDACFPDYTIYPSCDYAIGYITRGCVNHCRWCIVPRKEGDIHPYRDWRFLMRADTNKLVLMDNNILASDFGIAQLKDMIGRDVQIDLNQGIDARLVTPEIAEILARLHWIRFIRFSCDQKSQIESVIRAANYLKWHGIKTSKIFIYLLITEDIGDALSRLYALRVLKNATVYGMPERNLSQSIMPDREQRVLAQQYIYSGAWRKADWDEWKQDHPFYFTEKRGRNKNGTNKESPPLPV